MIDVYLKSKLYIVILATTYLYAPKTISMEYWNHLLVCRTELLLLHNNTWKHFTVYKWMNSHEWKKNCVKKQFWKPSLQCQKWLILNRN